jgi:hypothetical protein
MKNNPPPTWDELRISRPLDDSPPGSVLSVHSGRVIVRSYDTQRSKTVELSDDSSGRHYLDVSYIKVLESRSTPLVDDTIFYVGEIHGDDAVNLWRPTRVVWVGQETDGYVHVYSLTDSHLFDRHISEPCVPLHLLSESERNLVRDLAMSLEPATKEQSRQLCNVFDCDWLVPLTGEDW